MTVDFVFVSWAAKQSHVLPRSASPNSIDSALCGCWPRSLGLWLGTGSHNERLAAEELDLCKTCKKIGREEGYDLGPKWNLPAADPFGLTIETEAGDVDLVVVQRVLGGIRVEYSLAEKIYIINELLRSIEEHPPGPSGGRVPADPRYVLAAAGMGVGPELVRHWVCDRSKVLRRRAGRSA